MHQQHLWNVGGIIINEVSGGEKNKGEYFHRQDYRWNKRYFLPFTSVPSLCGASVLQCSGSNYRVSNQSNEKRKPFPVILASEDTDRSVKTVCCAWNFIVSGFFLRGFIFPRRLRVPSVRAHRESRWLLGVLCGRRPAPRGVSRILRIRCGNWPLHVAALAAFHKPQRLCYCVRPQVSGDAVSGRQVVFFTICAHHTQRRV